MLEHAVSNTSVAVILYREIVMVSRIVVYYYRPGTIGCDTAILKCSRSFCSLKGLLEAGHVRVRRYRTGVSISYKIIARVVIQSTLVEATAVDRE